MKRGEFFQRFLFGRLVHPFERLDSIAQRRFQIVDQLERTRFCFRREIFRHVKFAERFPDGLVGRNHDAFPARLDLFRAAQSRIVEIEVLVHEVFRELGGGGVDKVPAQISFPIVDRGVRESCAGDFEEVRLMNVDVARLDKIDFFEVIGPVPIRRERLQVGLRHFVVVFLRIAQFDAGARGLRKRSFQRENLFRVLARGRLRFAEQRQHLRDMIDILVAQLLRSIVRFRVVIAVRHAESALNNIRNHHGAVLVVLPGAEPEECANPERVQMRDFFEHIIAIFHRVDALELVVQRFGAHGFNRFLVHAAAVIITDLLKFRRGFWIDM